MAESSSDSSPLVLVADDDKFMIDLVTFRLERAGYEVVTAVDGDEALRAALEREPDLAVLDVRMPKLDGFELTSRIRRNEATSRMPIILLSGSVQDESIARGFEAGADDYLKKPFSPQELLARVQAILGRR